MQAGASIARYHAATFANLSFFMGCALTGLNIKMMFFFQKKKERKKKKPDYYWHCTC